MSDQFLVTYDECGDLTVRGGWVFSRSGARFRVCERVVLVAPLDQVGEIEAQESLGEIYLGGSGRNLVVSGIPGVGAPNGVWQHGYSGKWAFGDYTLTHDLVSGGASISDTVDVVATLAAPDGPDGSFASTAYGETLFGAPFSAVVALEAASPGEIPPAVVQANAEGIQAGIYAPSDAANFESEDVAGWTIFIAEDGVAELRVGGVAVAIRDEENAPNNNPSGRYPSTEAGLPYNPTEPEEPEAAEDPETNPFGILTIVVSWPGGMLDLDSRTEFLDEVVGYPGPYSTDFMDMTSGDDTEAGPETIIIDLAAAWTAGNIAGWADVLIRADWFPPASSGPAQLDITYSIDGFVPISMEIYPRAGTDPETSPAQTLAAAIRISADGTVAANYDAWEASVTRLRIPPPAGWVYLELVETAGTLTAVNGPFLAVVLPASTSTEFYVPLAESDGLGGVERLVSGPIIWTDA